jgi:beta-galactosidase
MVKRFSSAVLVVLLFAAGACFTETYNGEPSNRAKINLGETPWKFAKSDPANAKDSSFIDLAWATVGIPHCWNDTDTYINQQSGGGDGSMAGGICWYRKHFTLDAAYAGRKIFVEFEGVHVGAQVYINGTMIPGNSPVNPAATHVIGFIGFVVDISDRVSFGGADNVLAVRVSKNGGYYTDPGFSLGFRFGQSDGGIFRPVWMHITDKVHVPMNVYSIVNQWGTCVAATAATDASATVRILTNVLNSSATGQAVTLTTKVVDATHTVVLTKENTQTIAAGQAYVFDQSGDIANPHLWYPNNSIYGKPYMHKVYHIVKVGGATVDVSESPLGIRTITWDKDFPYINGHKHLLWGAASRYDYPALGTAIPEEQQWRDVKILTDAGGSLWRPGHSSHSPEMTAACDAFGVMLIQPSGEGEGAFSNASGNRPLKLEIQRDVIVRDRNNPSILAWEVSNGDMDPAFATQTRACIHTWDTLAPRAQSVRGGPGYFPGDLIACTLTGCEAQQKQFHYNNPWWGAEAWGRQSSRFAYDFEIAFAAEFMRNWTSDLTNPYKCFGLCQWYLAETPGEVGNFLEGGSPRSFGSSMMDFNRIPKMLYKIYAAAWIPFSIKPVVFLAHHWNRSGNVRVNAFSNCPGVRLKINGNDQGAKTPNPFNGTNNMNDLTQNTTQLPFQCYWDVVWAAGTLRAEGLDSAGNVVCFDEKKTAGSPNRVVLTVEPPLVKPSGESFQIQANGSDCAFILATVVDSAGVWCPTASNNITFTVSGPGNYRGGSDQFVKAGGLHYHSPGDPELSAEGGMCKVAVRAMFTPGTVTVVGTSAGIGVGTCSFTVYPINGCSCGLGSARQPASASCAIMPSFRVRASAGTVRYFVSRPANISFEILNAGGKLVDRVQYSKQSEGWHVLLLTKRPDSNGARGNGVYFVRCTVDGKYVSVKRVVFAR